MTFGTIEQFELKQMFEMLKTEPTTNTGDETRLLSVLRKSFCPGLARLQVDLDGYQMSSKLILLSATKDDFQVNNTLKVT